MWQRIPALIRGIVGGTAMAALGTTPWALLVSANLKHLASIPWSVPPALLYLWLFWRFAGGRLWPHAGGGTRRESLRANPVSERLWGPALLAGMLGLAATVFLEAATARLAPLDPEHAAVPLAGVSPLTLMLIVPTGALVAGVAEEAAFRGYMQGPIERRHGPAVAILTTGLLFGLAHFTHPGATLAWLPYYLAVASVYGALAWLTNSILPSLLLHAGGNFLAGLPLLAFPAAGPPAAAAAAGHGPESPLWPILVALAVSTAAALAAFAFLARAARREQPAACDSPPPNLPQPETAGGER